MSAIRIVHLSDIHFGQEIDGSRPEHDDVRQALLRDCKDEMVGKLGPANGLVVTGDIAYSGKKKEYERAGDWLDELAKIVGCEKNAVHTIPGNHDVDLAGITYPCELLHKELRNCTADKVDEILTKITPDAAEVSPLLDKLGSYVEFASRYESDFETAARPVSRKEIKFPTGHILRFLGLNSVQVSDKTDAPRKMVLGNRQYIFAEEQDVEYVVMSHHPLEWFKDKPQAYPRLISRGRVILTGHEHEAAFRKVQENDREYIVIDAGATSPPGGGEKRPHTYNWIEFTLGQDHVGRFMTVTIHPRVWVPGSGFPVGQDSKPTRTVLVAKPLLPMSFVAQIMGSDKFLRLRHQKLSRRFPSAFTKGRLRTWLTMKSLRGFYIIFGAISIGENGTAFWPK
jgi:DNA repair exonuclease SbcCD nuclease subunit